MIGRKVVDVMINGEIERFLKETFRLTDVSGYNATKLTEGFSGAEVYLLEITKPQRHREIGVYILKVIDTSSRWYDNDNNEARKSEKIYSGAEHFKNHLVKVKESAIVDGKLVMILSYALRTKLSSISLDQLQIDNKLEILNKISYDLLAGLNFERVEVSEECEVVERLCAYRLDENGNFFNRLKQHIFEVNKPAININGEILPNPYYYISRLNELLKNQNLQYIKGITHGDLHQKNIFTLVNSDDYVIIDYDSCVNNYLLFDQAYLELNCYMQLAQTWDLEKWMRGMEYIFQIADRESVEFAGIIKIEEKIRGGIERWYNEEFPNMLDSFHVQLQLARIAAGINFFSKGAITGRIQQIKYLIYISYGFKELFSLLNYSWGKSNASRLINKEVDSDYVILLWNECGKMRNEYIKILITDDEYETGKYNDLTYIAEIDWKLIVDVGEKTPPADFLNVISPIIKKYNSIRYIDDEDFDDISISKYGNTSILQLKLGKGMSSFQHWKMFKDKFVPVYKSICANAPLKSILFVLDFRKNSVIRGRFVEMLWEEELVRKGSRFICLGQKHEIPLQAKELEEKSIKYFEHEDMNLEDLTRMIEAFGLRRELTIDEIQLPSIESLDGRLTIKEWNDYNSFVEIVYSGIEKKIDNYTNGEEFYKGNEITWLDIAQKKHIEWSKYQQWKELIIKKLQIERIAECKLCHGAGAGGTTLSKLLMWDIKDINPTLRIRKFSSGTADVIANIYRKTGKSVFVVLEMGTTVISEDELELLKRKINAQSCHALFLKVERTTRKDDSDAEIYLGEDLMRTDAIKFYETYCCLTDDENRRRNLSSITYENRTSQWSGQCCPFFYGFYTFQEEYQGLGHFLTTSIRDCDEKTKEIIADLSIITAYSQNICMPYEEIAMRLGLEDVYLVEIFNALGGGVEKILIQRENGLRICHPLIARKLIELIFNQYSPYSNQLFSATIKFIDNKDAIYGKTDRKYLDEVFKEIFIDRSYIDGEQQKFAVLINELEKQSLRIKIFEKLKKLYSDNPHYYNHLGRLEIYDKNNLQFDKAVANLKKAVSVAKENKFSQVPHYTTLGCIYSEEVLSNLNGQDQSVEQLLEKIRVDFGNANECFSQARKLKENTTYAYFPNILMISNIVKKMTYTTGKPLETLLQNSTFAKWYAYYSGVAIQLYDQMKRNCEEELPDELRAKAEEKIFQLKGNVNALKIRLKKQRESGLELKECCHLGRTICMLLYMQNEYKWEDMEQDELCYVEKEMMSILETGEYNQNDVNVWFNAYRYMKSFDYSKAKKYLLDYMEEGYYKNYLLWILNFAEYQKGVQSYAQVNHYLNACKNNQQLVERGIRTTRNIDAYTDEENGFPIKRVGGIKDDNGELLNVKMFTGQVTSIDGTVKGKIRLDATDNIEITFCPSYMDGDNKIEFTRADISSQVKFNLIFTYSGYKAWNPRKI